MEFRNARQQQPEPKDPMWYVMVEDRPYFPALHVSDINDTKNNNDNDDDANNLRKMVAAIFQIPSSPNFRVDPVVGGNTNILYCVSNIRTAINHGTATHHTPKNYDDLPEHVLVRIFGGHGLIDRDIETATYAALAQQGIALPYYGRFGNGRVEGWFENGRCIHESEMGTLTQGIARSLAQVHTQFKIPEHLKPFHNPSHQPTMWKQLFEWIQVALNATYRSEKDTLRVAALNVHSWKDEIQFLKEKVIPKDAKVGFCHNDLLAANIMVDKNHQIQLIDFEYGGMNYLTYDIANHFNEYAGGTDPSAVPQYSRFPSKSLQQDFLRQYLNTKHSLQTTKHASEEDSFTLDTELVCMLREMDGFILANHMVWALWAVNQASTAGCEGFDYLLYAKGRIDRYWEDKSRWEEERSTRNETKNEPWTSSMDEQQVYQNVQCLEPVKT